MGANDRDREIELQELQEIMNSSPIADERDDAERRIEEILAEESNHAR